MREISLFEPFTIKNIKFDNRIVRSSLGGRMAYYDGRVSPAWVNFEKRVAKGGVAAIISTTMNVNKDRMSPPQYPTIHTDCDYPTIHTADCDCFIRPLRDAVKEIKKAGTGKVRYIMQIGDTG